MKISVLMHEKDPPASSYTISLLLEEWRGLGYEVEVLRGLAQPIRGDLVFLHVDLTVVPGEYLRAVEGHPRVLNRGLTDISKNRFSRIQVHSPDDWSGPVIVKTVRNHGGYPERRLRRGTVLGRLRNLVSRLGLEPLAVADSLNPYHYPIYPCAGDVPRGVFSNRALIVERFLPERCGDSYCMYLCRFLGDHSICERFESRSPITRLAGRALPEVVPVDRAIASARVELGMDYGKLDYLIHEGAPVLIDVNRTPSGSVAPERARRHVAALAPGISEFAL